MAPTLADIKYLAFRLSAELGGAPEDHLGDAWLRTQKASFDPDRASWKTYAWRIARNAKVDHVRELQVRRVVSDLTDIEPQHRPTHEIQDPIDTAQIDETLLLTARGLSMAQIGAALGIPAGTVKSRLHRYRRNTQIRRLPIQ